MNPDEIKKLRIQARNLEPLVRVGKNGINEGTLREIEKNIKKHKLIKVRLLKAITDSEDRKKFGEDLAKKSRTNLIQVIGSIVILYRR